MDDTFTAEDLRSAAERTGLRRRPWVSDELAYFGGHNCVADDLRREGDRLNRLTQQGQMIPTYPQHFDITGRPASPDTRSSGRMGC